MRLWSKRVAYMASLFVLLIVLFECRGGTPRSKRNTTISTVPKMLPLLVSFGHQSTSPLTPRALPLPSLPLAGTPNALPCLSLVCVCLCVGMCV